MFLLPGYLVVRLMVSNYGNGHQKSYRQAVQHFLRIGLMGCATYLEAYDLS